MTQPDHTQVKKQLEAVRRSGRTNMLEVNTVKLLAAKCPLPELAEFLSEANAQAEYMPLMQESADEWRGVEDEEIDDWADRLRDLTVTVEI